MAKLSAVVVAVLAILVAVKSWRPKSESNEWWTKSEDDFCFDNYCLKKEENNWIVESQDGVKMAAENELVEVMADRIKQAKLVRLASTNSDKFAELGIGTEPIVKLEGWQIGSILPDWDGTFVKKDGEEKVWVIDIALDKNDLANLEYWQMKNLTNIARDQIKNARVKLFEEERDIEIKDEFSNIKAGKFLVDFEPAEMMELVIETETGEEKVWLGQKDKIYWASRDLKYFFEIDKEVLDLLK